MGYDTNFSGTFSLDKPLTVAHKAYLAAFADTRRMKRDVSKVSLLPDPLRVNVGLPYGPEGCYHVGGLDSDDVLDHNKPPEGQPGLWCQWVPTEDGTGIEWDSGEKFYAYLVWIPYLIDHFLKPWGYVVNGKVEWSGDDDDDRGCIHVRNNVVKAVKARIVNEEPDWGDSDDSQPDPAPDPIDSIVEALSGEDEG